MSAPTEPADAQARRFLADSLAREVMARWSGKELDRVMEGLDVWCYRKPARVHKGQRAMGFHVPGLPDAPWIDPASFECGDILTDAYEGIRDEVSRFLDGRMVAPPHGLPDDARSDAAALSGQSEGWREWRFVARNGRFLDERCRDFPITAGALRQVAQRIPLLVNALLLTLRPGTLIPPHTDPINAYADLWLGIFVPKETALCVRGETRAPVEGGLLGFDHTFEHTAWNRSDGDRIVLSLLIHNPGLRPHEREIAGFLIHHLAKFGATTVFEQVPCE